MIIYRGSQAKHAVTHALETNIGYNYPPVCEDEHPTVGDEHPPVCGDEHPSVGDEHPYAGDEHSPVGDEHRHVCGDEHKGDRLNFT